MNKTININLGGMFFHIDEEAFFKLQKYLDTIKRSLTSAQGRDEIIADIEARIAELFTERLVNERQVINAKDVNEVIEIMGQPEDYMVDEEIFDDEPSYQRKSGSNRKSNTKQLLRDPDNKYIAGVSSGLGHYFGIDTVWIRLIWVLFVVLGFGSPILVYIIFWIVMPEARTTAQKLSMRGEPVNISNIEKKVKEGFEDVADRVKNVDYEKVGNRVKSGSQTIFESLGNVIIAILKIIGKIAGVLVIIISISMLIGLFVSFMIALFGSNHDGVHIPFHLVDKFFLHGFPLWVLMLLIFLSIGIPTFFLLILGIKIVASNVKPLGNIGKYSLLAVWILSIIGLIYLGINNSFENSVTSTLTEKEEFYIQKNDTLTIALMENEMYEQTYKKNGLTLIEEDGKQMVMMHDVRLDIKPTIDSVAYVKVQKRSSGKDYSQSKDFAEGIEYGYVVTGNTIKLKDYLLTNYDNEYLNQDIFVTVYVPSNIYINLDHSVRNIIHDIENDKRIYDRDMPQYNWIMGKTELECLDCEDDEEIEIETEIETEFEKSFEENEEELIESDKPVEEKKFLEVEKITTEKETK